MHENYYILLDKVFTYIKGKCLFECLSLCVFVHERDEYKNLSHIVVVNLEEDRFQCIWDKFFLRSYQSDISFSI